MNSRRTLKNSVNLPSRAFLKVLTQRLSLWRERLKHSSKLIKNSEITLFRSAHPSIKCSKILRISSEIWKTNLQIPISSDWRPKIKLKRTRKTCLRLPLKTFVSRSSLSSRIWRLDTWVFKLTKSKRDPSSLTLNKRVWLPISIEFTKTKSRNSSVSRVNLAL